MPVPRRNCNDHSGALASERPGRSQRHLSGCAVAETHPALWHHPNKCRNLWGCGPLYRQWRRRV